MTPTSALTLLALAMSALTRQGAQDAARHELAKPPYQEALPPWWQRPLRWLLGHLGRSWSTVAASTGGPATLFALILLMVVLGVILWRVGPMARRARRAGADLGLDRPTTPADHRAEAERWASQQQWAEAVRERLRAISRDLEDRTLVDRRPGRTAYELAGEGGRALPGSAEALGEAAQRFAAIWYGGVAASAEDYQRLTAIDAVVSRDRPVRTAEVPAELVAP